MLILKVFGPVVDAIQLMARWYDPNDERFLNDFRHMSRHITARLDEIFDIFIHLPHTAAGSNETAARPSTTASVLQ